MKSLTYRALLTVLTSMLLMVCADPASAAGLLKMQMPQMQQKQKAPGMQMEKKALPPSRVKVTGFALSPARASSGDTVTLTFTVETTGVGFLSVPWAVTLDGGSTPIVSGTRPGVSGGSTFDVTATWRVNASIGQHFLWLVLDPANTLKEAQAERGDNVSMKGITVVSPQRVNVHWGATGGVTPASPNIGDAVTIKAHVQATGGGPGSVPWTIYRNGVALTSGTRQVTGAGANFDISASWTATPGQHQFHAEVDPQNTWNEPQSARADNKSVVLPVTVAGPDLVPVSCIVEPASPKDTQRLGFRLKYKNQGTRPAFIRPGANYSQWVKRVDGGPGGGGAGFVGNQPLTIEPGATKDDWANGGILPAGTYSFTYTVDDYNAVAETNETNNAMPCGPVTVVADPSYVDLRITTIVVDPPNPTSQTNFRLRVTVKNEGTTLAPISDHMMILGADTFDLSPVTTTSGSLGAGESRTFDMYPTTLGAQPGTKTWIILVDPRNSVRESNENNNQSSITVVVQ